MIVTILSFVFILTLVVLRIAGGRPGRVTLLEYQRGVLYRRGLPVREVGTGRHLTFIGIEKIMMVDVRPVQVSFESQAVALRDGLTALYSFAGSARIQDARKAVYSAANYNHVPAFVMLCCARLVLNGCSASQLKTKEAVTEQIVNCAKPRLAAAGFELLSFRINDLSIGHRATQ
jgi:hypothetical protein